MLYDSETPFKTWLAALPLSQMVYPNAFTDRLKYGFWRVYTPYHPGVRDACAKLGLINHTTRQNYLIGTIAPKHSIQDVISYLISRGYGNHFVAWKDPGEVVSLRCSGNFFYQYHIRIFEDREVRGHYEFTPEFRPWRHLKMIGQEARRDEFLALLKDWISLEE